MLQSVPQSAELKDCPEAKVIQQDATAQSLLRILKKSTVEVAKDECVGCWQHVEWNDS